MKVAIITDTHWGARNDSLSLINFFDKFYTDIFIPKLIEEKIDTVLMLGDTFDRRKYTNHVSLHHAKRIYFDALKRLGVSVHMLVGNHDTAYKNTNAINSPGLLLREYSNINIIDEPRTVNVHGLDICFLPWICSDNYAQSLKEIEDTKAEICMGHLEVSGFAMYRGVASHGGMSKEVFNKFDMVFSGHYHHKSDDGHIYYLGNPYELTWQDCKDPRGFHLFDVKTRKLEFVQNTYTLFDRFEYDDSKFDPDGIDTSHFSDKYVKIIVVCKKDLYKFDTFIDRVYKRNPLEVKIIENFSEYIDGQVDEKINLEDTTKVMFNYIDSVEVNLNKDSLKSFMKTLYTEAINREI